MAHDVAVLVRVKILDGQILHLLKHFLTHFGKEALRDISHELRLRDGGKDRQDIKPCQHENVGNDLSGRCLPGDLLLDGDVNRIHDGLNEHGGNGRDDGREQNADQRDGVQTRIKLKDHLDHATEHFEIDLTAWGLAALTHGGTGLACGHVGFIHRPYLLPFAARGSRGKYHSSQGARRACPWRRSCRFPSQG